MHSSAVLARVRRLTDTQAGPSSSKSHTGAVAAEQQHGTNSAAGNISSSNTPELLSVVSCYGGGLEANKTAQVGNFRITYSVHTQAGADPGGNTKENQDAWCIQEKLAGQDMALFGVFDGHGQEGKTVSNSVCQNVPKFMAKMSSCKPGTLEAALSATFPEANKALKRLPGLDADLSGSTGITAVLTQSKLVVANLGDSRCVLGKVDIRGTVSAVALSIDHTPMDPREAGRIVAAGGRIASFMCGDEPLGPPRVWLRDVNIPGLCMTRSFGDLVAASVGVIDEPQVVTTTLRPEDKYIVLMSDGIFEFIDSQRVLEEVHAAAQAGQPPNEAARRLVKLARKCWQEQEEEIIDDCTAMVIYLSPATSSSATGSANSSTPSTGRASIEVSGLATRMETSLNVSKTATGLAGVSGAGASKAAHGNQAPGLLGYKRG